MNLLSKACLVLACLDVVSDAAFAEPSDLKFSPRAFQCEAYEFAELESMQRAELEGMYCSYSIGAARLSRRNDETKVKYADQPQILAALLGDNIRLQDQCVRGMAKVQDLIARKYTTFAPNCSPMAEKIETALAKQSPQSSPAMLGRKP